MFLLYTKEKRLLSLIIFATNKKSRARVRKGPGEGEHPHLLYRQLKATP